MFGSYNPTAGLGGDLIGTGAVGQNQFSGQKKQPTLNYALEGLGGFGGTMAVNTNQPVELIQTPDLDSERFQQLWMQLPDC